VPARSRGWCRPTAPFFLRVLGMVDGGAPLGLWSGDEVPIPLNGAGAFAFGLFGGDEQVVSVASGVSNFSFLNRVPVFLPIFYSSRSQTSVQEHRNSGAKPWQKVS